MSKENVDINIHLNETTVFSGHADILARGPYSVIRVGKNYPQVTVFPSAMVQCVQMADSCLDALSDMVRLGAEIDGESGEALARLAERVRALSFDEEAEARAAEAVTQ